MSVAEQDNVISQTSSLSDTEQMDGDAVIVALGAAHTFVEASATSELSEHHSVRLERRTVRLERRTVRLERRTVRLERRVMRHFL